MKGYIYQIENLVTHESYIGQTINIQQRKNRHFSRLRNNSHINKKLQNSFNKYGEQEFHFRYWEFEIENREELDNLECEYIKKYNSLNNGFNLVEGGGKPPSRRLVKEQDVIGYLCVLEIYGDGYGKTFEDICGWSKGTANKIKNHKLYNDIIEKFLKINVNEKIKIAKTFFEDFKIKERALKRQLKQGGTKIAYMLTQDDYNFAFLAQEYGYSYTAVAKYLGVQPATVKDWFNGRSRRKNKEIYKLISPEEKKLLISRLKIAELSGNPKLIPSN